MALVVNKDIVAKLIEAVEQLTIKNAYLTTKLSNAMKLNLEMAKKLNLEATQAQDPEAKILMDKAKRKAAFESNLDSDGY